MLRYPISAPGLVVAALRVPARYLADCDIRLGEIRGMIPSCDEWPDSAERVSGHM